MVNDFRYLEKLVEKTRFTDSCWLWEGTKNKGGYGAFYISGKSPIGVHRISYEMFNGPIINGEIRHTCDIPNCWNPDHLLDGTHQENMKDIVNRNRQAKGHKNSHSKLTPEQLQEIRALGYPMSWRRMKQTAQRYNMSPVAIYDILKGNTYRE